jgi:hypothetical protein
MTGRSARRRWTASLGGLGGYRAKHVTVVGFLG